MTFNRYSLDLEASSSQYAYIADNAALSITGDISIEAWVKPESAVAYASLVYKGLDDGSPEINYSIDTGADGLTPRFIYYNGGFNAFAITTAKLVVGSWNHLAFVYTFGTGSTAKFYLNGVDTTSSWTAGTGNSAGVDNGESLYIGRTNLSSPIYFDGKLNNVRLWSDIRTQTEIQDNMYLTITGTSNNLVGSWFSTANDYNDLAGTNDLTASGSPVFSTNVPWTGANDTDWTSQEIQADYTKVSGSSNLTDYPALIKDDNIPDAVYTGLSQATVTATHLATATDATNAASYATASVDLSAKKLVLLAVVNGYSSASNIPTVSGASRTWTMIDTQMDESGFRRTTLFRSLSSSANSGALTIDFAGQTQLRCAHSISEFGNVDISGVNGAGAIVQSAKTTSTGSVASLTASLGAFSNVNNATYGVIGIGRVATGAFVTPGSGFTELGEVYTPAEGAIIETEWKNSNDTSVDWSFASGIDNSGIAVEIKSGAGQDLRITTDSAGTTEIPFEIVSLDTTAKTCEIHAKIPTISYTVNTPIYLWYGNASAVAYDANAPFGSQAVWSGYKGVWHTTGASVTNIVDSSSNAQNFTTLWGGTTFNATGKIGKGISTDGTDDAISIATPTTLNMADPYTIQYWANITSASCIPISKGYSGSTGLEMFFYVDASGYIKFGSHNTSSSEQNSGSYSTDIRSAWHLFSGKRYSTTLEIVVDGVSRNTGSITGTLMTNKGALVVGGQDNTGGVLITDTAMTFDELRISNTTPTNDWIATEYANQNSPSTFWTEVSSRRIFLIS